ncbi:MAG: DNA alkylation repair protein [Candidatus Omnitrophota bacterium]
MTAQALQKDLKNYSSKEKAKILQRFFKTGPGEYAQGDRFIGVKVPQIRAVVKKHRDIDIKHVVTLLKSPIHEERLAALLLLVLRYKQSKQPGQEKIYQIYLKHTRQINNWDLVDLSAEHIVGAFLRDKTKTPLYALAQSASLWERRIAMLSTFHYIKQGFFEEALKIASLLLRDEEDLIHKAVGWMLREVGKRDNAVEEQFLRRHYRQMPRTMLRYAIEKFPEAKRQAYLQGTV